MIILRLDKNSGLNKNDVKAFEHDNLSEAYIIQLLKYGEIYDLTNKTVELTILEKKRKVGNMFNLPIYNVTEGKVELNITSALTRLDGIYDFKLTIRGFNGLIETFPSFQVEIENDITDHITGEIVQDKNFTILTEGLKALADYNIYKTNALKVPEIEQDIVEINEQLDIIESEANIGCVIRPTTDINNPWELFQDSAHESKGVTAVTYNRDGTLTLNFDKTYSKIRSFNAFNDEMMKIYGLEVGASTGLASAKLYLISKLIVGTSLTFTQNNQSITVSKSGHVESATWVSGTGVVVKFKNVPKQTPNSVQVTVTNALNLKATCSITGDREITIKFYKVNGELISDITGNWSCMIDANFTGLVDFNCTSVYDSNILSSMALMYNVHMKQ